MKKYRENKTYFEAQKKVNEWPEENKKIVLEILESSNLETDKNALIKEFNNLKTEFSGIYSKVDELRRTIVWLKSECKKAFSMVDDKNFESIEVTKKNIADLAGSVESISIKAGQSLDTMKALNVRMRFSKMFYLVIGALMGVMFSSSFNFILKLYCYAPENPKFIYILCGLGGILPGVIIGAFLSNRN